MLSFFTYIHKMKTSKEKLLYMKEYYQRNIERIKQKETNNYYQSKGKNQKNQVIKTTLPYWIVYQLPNADDYIGKTNNPYKRMIRHKIQGRDTSGWIELHRFDTEAEALAKEAEYHNQGYPGAYGWKHNEIEK